jgi:hypothetical protein
LVPPTSLQWWVVWMFLLTSYTNRCWNYETVINETKKAFVYDPENLITYFVSSFVKKHRHNQKCIIIIFLRLDIYKTCKLNAICKGESEYGDSRKVSTNVSARIFRLDTLWSTFHANLSKLYIFLTLRYFRLVSNVIYIHVSNYLHSLRKALSLPDNDKYWSHIHSDIENAHPSQWIIISMNESVLW